VVVKWQCGSGAAEVGEMLRWGCRIEGEGRKITFLAVVAWDGWGCAVTDRGGDSMLATVTAISAMMLSLDGVRYIRPAHTQAHLPRSNKSRATCWLPLIPVSFGHPPTGPVTANHQSTKSEGGGGEGGRWTAMQRYVPNKSI
jgi:hypothetical protein